MTGGGYLLQGGGGCNPLQLQWHQYRQQQLWWQQWEAAQAAQAAVDAALIAAGYPTHTQYLQYKTW